MIRVNNELQGKLVRSLVLWMRAASSRAEYVDGKLRHGPFNFDEKVIVLKCEDWENDYYVDGPFMRDTGTYLTCQIAYWLGLVDNTVRDNSDMVFRLTSLGRQWNLEFEIAE